MTKEINMEENSDKIIGVAGNSSDGHLKDIYGAHGDIGLGFRHEEDHTKFWDRIHNCGTKFAVLTDKKRKSIKPHYCNEPFCHNEHCSEYRQNLFFGKYFKYNHNAVFVNIADRNNGETIIDRPVWSMVDQFKTENEHDVRTAYSSLAEIRKEIKDKYAWFMLAYTSRGIELLRPTMDNEIPSSKEEIINFVKAYTDISLFDQNVINFIRINYKNRKRIRSKGIKTNQKVYKNAIEGKNSENECSRNGNKGRNRNGIDNGTIIFHAMRYRPLEYVDLKYADNTDTLNLPLAKPVDARKCSYYVETSNLRADLTFDKFVEKVRHSLGGSINNILDFENYQFRSMEDGEIVIQFIAYFGAKNRKIIKIIEREYEEYEHGQDRNRAK